MMKASLSVAAAYSHSGLNGRWSTSRSGFNCWHDHTQTTNAEDTQMELSVSLGGLQTVVS